MLNEVDLIVILDNLRSLYNVGSIFRTADAMGIKTLHLVGMTGHPHPDEPWRSDHQRLKKIALGSEQTVSWDNWKDIQSCLVAIRHEGRLVIGLEITPSSQSLEHFKPPPGQSLALVVGNELAGLDPLTQSVCDAIVAIPMRGRKESLNVSIAFGIAAYQLIYGGYAVK